MPGLVSCSPGVMPGRTTRSRSCRTGVPGALVSVSSAWLGIPWFSSADEEAEEVAGGSGIKAVLPSPAVRGILVKGSRTSLPELTPSSSSSWMAPRPGGGADDGSPVSSGSLSGSFVEDLRETEASEVPEGAIPVTSSISEGLDGVGKMPGGTGSCGRGAWCWTASVGAGVGSASPIWTPSSTLSTGARLPSAGGGPSLATSTAPERAPDTTLWRRAARPGSLDRSFPSTSLGRAALSCELLHLQSRDLIAT